MSGGSYDYYYCKNAEEGIFESLGQLKQMIPQADWMKADQMFC